MHVHTGSSLLAPPWLPLPAWEQRAGREGCGSREPPSLPAAAEGLIPAPLVPAGAGQARLAALRSAGRGNAGKGKLPLATERPRSALRLAGSCWLLQPPATADRVCQRPPQGCFLKRLSRAEEYWERVRWGLAAWLLCSRRECCWPRDFAAASSPVVSGEQRG